MNLVKPKTASNADLFLNTHKGKKFTVEIENGEIIKCETSDLSIITDLKSKGLVEV